MLTLFSAVFGFAAPFLPQVLKLFERKMDYAHELKMFELRMSLAAKEHEWRIEEINVKGDIQEMVALRSPQQSFGVTLLDAAKPWAETSWGKWLISPAFALFALLDFTSGMVRPLITYLAFGFYCAYKIALYFTLSQGNTPEAAILMLWTEQDWGIVILVLSYWFGARTAKAVFGGSASSSKRDG